MVKRREVRLLEGAADDLREIFLSVAASSGSDDVALRYVRRLRSSCERLDILAERGRSRDDLAPGLRSLAFERTAIAFYLIENGTVDVVRIFHGGRDYEAIMRRDPGKQA